MDEESDQENDRTAYDQRKKGIDAQKDMERIGWQGAEHDEFPMGDIQYSGNAIKIWKTAYTIQWLALSWLEWTIVNTSKVASTVILDASKRNKQVNF